MIGLRPIHAAESEIRTIFRITFGLHLFADRQKSNGTSTLILLHYYTIIPFDSWLLAIGGVLVHTWGFYDVWSNS